MEIRPISAGEKMTAEKIQSIAFAFTGDYTDVKDQEDTDNDEYKVCRAVFDQNGKMCSCLELLPFEVMFNNKIVPMSGISGLATLPEEIGKKYAQHLMYYCVAEAYEKGDVFSYLYPFSQVYYRKFGYELNMRVNSYSLPTDEFMVFKDRKPMKLFLHGDDRKDIQQVYTDFIYDKNLSVVRNDGLWDEFFEKDPFKDNVYIYVLYDSKDRPRGYIKYGVEKKSIDDKDLLVNELVWLDFEALSGIFAFLAGLAPQFETVQWRGPDFLDLRLLFPEPYDVECEASTHGMNRIINVQKCLELLEAPDGSGCCTIEVIDDFLTVNSGKYNISWENGFLEVKKSNKEPDITSDIRPLSQLVTGFATPKELKSINKIILNGNIKQAEKLFPKKMLYINDGF